MIRLIIICNKKVLQKCFKKFCALQLSRLRLENIPRRIRWRRSNFHLCENFGAEFLVGCQPWPSLVQILCRKYVYLLTPRNCKLLKRIRDSHEKGKTLATAKSHHQTISLQTSSKAKNKTSICIQGHKSKKTPPKKRKNKCKNIQHFHKYAL